MTQSKHAPGPYIRTEDGDANFYGISVQGRWLARIQLNGQMSAREQEATMSVFAAAPDLLKALETAKWMLERDYIDPQKMEVIEKCDAAIAKAEGR